MSVKITNFFSPIQKEVEITSKIVKSDIRQFKDQKVKKCSVVLKDFFEEIKDEKFKNLKFGPNVNNSVRINHQNQSKVEQKEDSKLKVRNNAKKCENFDKVFHNYQEYIKHKCIFKCQFCDSRFNFRTSLASHIKKKHQNEIKDLNISCYICDKFFISESSLESHMKIKHGNKSEHFECDFCGRIFMTKNKLYKHMKVHLAKVNCSICQAELAINTLYKHMKNVHAEGAKFQCQICGKAFKSKLMLSAHEKIHDKKFKCKICNKMFTENAKLNTHIKQYHLNPRSFTCEVCDRKFNTEVYLRMHQKIHNKNRPKPYKCQRCDYATDNQVHYQTHMKFHQRQDEKIAAMKNPIKCEKCPTFCKDKKSLSVHMRKVHPKEIFQCDLCGNYIKLKGNLNQHIKLHIKNRMN